VEDARRRVACATVKRPLLFPLDEVWWFYAAFVGFITLLLVLDLKVFHKKSHAVTSKEALGWSIFWIGLALAFNLALYLMLPGILSRSPRFAEVMPGADPALIATDLSKEFLNGYLVEMALSVDNLFVFIIIFSYFAIPPQNQHRILFWGILGAIILRGIFIAAGAVLMRFEWVVMLMGLFLIYTGIKIFGGKEEKVEPEKNPLIRIFRRFVPVTSRLEGEKFFVSDGTKRYATPLFIALLVVESTDVVFAIDSVPAIFGITSEPLIVFTSNMFAILGLRTLYFLLANAVDRFHYLKYGLGTILTFVGAKMSVLHYFHIDISPDLSLGVVLGVLAISILASFVIPRKTPPPSPDAAV
jgi:tellurite resistance protein TerC